MKEGKKHEGFCSFCINFFRLSPLSFSPTAFLPSKEEGRLFFFVCISRTDFVVHVIRFPPYFHAGVPSLPFSRYKAWETALKISESVEETECRVDKHMA